MAQELLDLARTIAIEAGALAARRRAEGVEVAASKSTAVDIVTEADRETEALIRGMLADARPQDGFFGEESGAEAGSSGLTWLVDPIDGTVNFLYGIPHYAVSIAVVRGGAGSAHLEGRRGLRPQPGERGAVHGARGRGRVARAGAASGRPARGVVAGPHLHRIRLRGRDAGAPGRGRGEAPAPRP
jgi:myo-inositol-1(or 4)-monophosphatase